MKCKDDMHDFGPEVEATFHGAIDGVWIVAACKNCETYAMRAKDGIPAEQAAQLVIANLRAAGLDPERIDS